MLDRKRKRCAAILAGAIALVMIVGAGTGVAFSARSALPETRPFYMGFTPFPYEISLPAVLYTYDRLLNDGDLMVHHFDNGVPWVEALSGATYSDNVMQDWRFRRSSTPDDMPVYVAVTPIHLLRDGLALYRGERDDMPLPAPWDSYSFNHPDVKAAFLNYCEAIIAYFDADFFAMGIEVNVLKQNNPALWDAYLELHRETYTALKMRHPELPIFVSVTGHHLLEGYTDSDHAAQLGALADIYDYTDYLAISLYPYLTRYMTTEIPATMFDELALLAGGKPIAITETGYPAQSFEIDSGPGATIRIGGTPEKQQMYIDRLLNAASQHQFRFVVNFVLRDYDALWRSIGAKNDLSILWRDTGLYDENGRARPALATWRAWLELPFAGP